MMIPRFEKKWSSTIGLPYAVTFWKGRVALYAILKAMGIGPGDEVLLPGFTCVVVPNAIIYCGAKPVFVDIPRNGLNIDVEHIRKAITPRTKVVIVQHTFGIPVDMAPIQTLVKEKGLYLVEDCAHCLGSTLHGKQMGTFGDAAFFSLQWSKPITTGLGGIAVTGNSKIGEALLKIQEEAIPPSFKETMVLKTQLLLYTFLFNPVMAWFALNVHRLLSRMGVFVGSSTSEELLSQQPKGFLKRYPESLARIAINKLSNSSRDAVHRQEISALYQKQLTGIGQTFYGPVGSQVVPLRYPLIVKAKNDLLKLAKKRNIEIGDWFLSPVHPNLDGWENAGYAKGSCPESEKCCLGIINLPTHSKISKAIAMRTISFIKSINKKGLV